MEIYFAPCRSKEWENDKIIVKSGHCLLTLRVIHSSTVSLNSSAGHDKKVEQTVSDRKKVKNGDGVDACVSVCVSYCIHTPAMFHCRCQCT